MIWIPLLLLVLYSYLLQLMQVQEHLKKREISVADANFLVRGAYDWRVKYVTTFLGLAIVIGAVVLLIITTGWWTPAWFIGGLSIGRIVVRITGNPLIGEFRGDRWFNK